MPLLKTEAPELQDIDTWINSEPVNLEEGVRLVYFWNYSCSCCKERLKIFQKIRKNYPEITVLGVHTPEFRFEREEKNLEKSVERLGIDHPIAHDRLGKIFESYNVAYSNSTLIIEKGIIKYQKSHKSGFEELTKKISKILGVENKGVDADLDKKEDIPIQIFLGYNRSKSLNEEGNYPGEKNYQLPERRKPETVYLKNVWNQSENHIEASEDSKLYFKSGSSKISIVTNPNDNIRDVKVLINGETVSEEEAGEDLRVENGKSYIRVKNPGLYNLIDSNRQKVELTLIPDKKTRIHALSLE